MASDAGERMSSAERQASFAPFAAATIERIPARDYVLLRYAALIDADDVIVRSAPGDPTAYSFEAIRARGIGSAIPIDRRGYFITAAHCLGTARPHVVFFGQRRLIVEPGEVIWRGDQAGGRLDLAVIRVPQALNFVFAWAPAVNVGEAVLAAGPNYSPMSGAQDVSFDFDCVAGRVLGVGRADALYPSAVCVAHSTPVHAGDSGGPLVNRFGQLVAVNTDALAAISTTATGATSAFPRAQSYRVDPVWLGRLIDADVLQRSTFSAFNP